MSFNIIERLRAVAPASRPEILETVYQKNLDFFRSKHPALLQFINDTKCPYCIDITDTFLSLTDERSGQLAHPEAGLDRFAEMLGGWTHEAWVDLFNFQIPMLHQYPKHYAIVNEFSTQLHQAFPDLSTRLAGARINLKELDNGKKFSPPVVFLGIFHGLHIAHYLEHTELTTALFIEPEPERFEVSCYFLDYLEIENRLGGLYLAIGEETTAAPIESFFSLLRITPMMWTRILCGYPFDKAHFFIESIKSLQATNTNLLYPLDNELDGLMHGVISLNQCLPLLTTRPQVSKQCRIAVVATGPSLENDLDWLKKNQHNLVIFAVHSSVKILRKHGIKPDFQFNLDAVINYNFTETLQLFPEIPFVTDYKAPPHLIANFKTPLLCADTHKNSVVHFHQSLTETHPSTTNLAFSFACFVKPAAIYLLGCDCGFRELSQDHARGSFYEDNRSQGRSTSYAERALQSLVEPNFAGTGPIQTISQHLRTKIVIEKCITANAQGISVVNLSDGALITGAKTQRSSATQGGKYNKKRADIKKILNAFAPAKEKKNWEPYPTPSSEKLQQLKDNLLHAVALEKFSWKGFGQALDAALGEDLGNNQEMDHDHRMTVFYRILGDLCCLWYRCLILFDEIEEAEKVYATGLRCIKEALEKLKWPQAFDQIQHAEMEERLTPEWKVYLAHLYGKQNIFTRAETLLANACDEAPDLKDSFIQLGWLHTEQQNWHEAFKLAVQDEIRDRLTPGGRVNLAQLYGRQGAFDHAVALIESAYTADMTLKDGFARLGWIQAEKKEWSAALQLAERDLATGRISPGWQVNIAQLYGRTGDPAQAETLITQAYNQKPQLKDGFARLGWINMENRDWVAALQWAERDLATGRVSPGWQVNIAQLYGRTGDPAQAETLITQAYNQNPQLKDGFARLGWINMENRDWVTAHEWLLKDQGLNRLSPDWKTYLAVVKGCLGCWPEAMALVAEAYSESATLRDGYSRLGWWGYLCGKGQEFFRDQHNKDKNNKPHSITHMLFQALYLTAIGAFDKALHPVEQAYRTDARLESWQTTVGWLQVRLGNSSLGLDLMQLDYTQGRMNQVWLPSYAIVLGMCGKKEQAMDIVRSVSLLSKKNAVHIIGYTAFPEAWMNITQLKEFIASRMGYEDIKKFDNPNCTSH